MTKIFISYRRDDSADITGRIYDRLVAKFGKDAVFKDVDNIPLGVDFREYIDSIVQRCAVELVIVGRQWLDITDDQGQRRLDNPGDFVRNEIESALNRKIPVIPLLVSSASMPPMSQLPPSLSALAFRNGTVVRRDPDFHRDMDRVIAGITPWLTRPTSINLMPPPFDWIEIPAGKVTLEEGGYIPKGGQTFDIAAFTIGKYPITNAQFAKFAEAGGYSEQRWWTDAGWQAHEQGIDWDASAIEWKPTGKSWTEPYSWQDRKWNQPNDPVIGVSWYEAVAFCHWLSDVTEEPITLPTEQQWQRAAQGNDGRVYPWGNDFDPAKCNTDESGIKQTTPVDRYTVGQSPFRVFDMAGNAWEWCLTQYTSGAQDIWSGANRVLRGGSWYDVHDLARTAYRRHFNSDNRHLSFGFRVVLVGGQFPSL